MRKLIAVFILVFLSILICCKNIVNKGGQEKEIDSTEVILTDKNALPIHGKLIQKQIDQYYGNILDTIKDRRVIAADPIELNNNSEFYVSLLHNAGTFDQMFLCTHDKNLKLIDTYYIGISTTYDKKSHIIDYQKVGDNSLEFHHVDWGYVKSKEDIDTTNYFKYVLVITESGKIVKK